MTKPDADLEGANRHVDGRKKVEVYGCPSPGCENFEPSAQEMAEHVNEEHDGEWGEGYWPEADDE